MPGKVEGRAKRVKEHRLGRRTGAAQGEHGHQEKEGKTWGITGGGGKCRFLPNHFKKPGEGKTQISRQRGLVGYHQHRDNAVVHRKALKNEEVRTMPESRRLQESISFTCSTSDRKGITDGGSAERGSHPVRRVPKASAKDRVGNKNV